MVKLEVFFDYICPHCLRGHGYLMELLPTYTGLEIEWHPCEAHPRPEKYGVHSDLCARGMYFALDHGADIAEYHRKMYEAALADRVNVEDIGTLTAVTDGLLDADALREVLAGNLYEDILRENNRLVWNVYDCPAVPSYRIGDELLKSQLGVGVSKEELEAFLDRHCQTV